LFEILFCYLKQTLVGILNFFYSATNENPLTDPFLFYEESGMNENKKGYLIISLPSKLNYFFYFCP